MPTKPTRRNVCDMNSTVKCATCGDAFPNAGALLLHRRDVDCKPAASNPTPPEQGLRIRGYPGTFHVQPTGSNGTVRPSERYPWELSYTPRKDGYGAEAGVVSVHKTKRQALAAFRKLKTEIFADRRESNARIKRMRQETK